MLARIDPKTYSVALISVPRDTSTEYNGQKMKLNEVYHIAGIEALESEVAKLTGVTPKYYLDMDFVQFEKFVDQLGGVTANVPINMQLVDIVSGDNIALNAGTQELNGPEALVLARSRKQYANDLDACRQIQDRQLVQVGIQQVAADPVNAALHVQALVDNCDTDWNAADLVETVKVFAQNADKIEFTSGTGPYQGDIDPDINLWLAYRDEATWAQIDRDGRGRRRPRNHRRLSPRSGSIRPPQAGIANARTWHARHVRALLFWAFQQALGLRTL